MGKTTNILDLNNRLEKVEKENVAQNSYTSLKNKPKINGVTLTGNKSLADIGAADAADVTTLSGDIGDTSVLSTTDKSSCVAAINEVNGKTGFQSFEVAIAGEQVENSTAILDTHIDLTAYQPICIFEKPPQDAHLSYTFNATGSFLIVKNYTTPTYTIPSTVGNISILCAKK